MAKKYMLLWFEAPLQSWGFDSKFGRRDSLKFPTRSGVLGLLCCALGYGGEQKEFLARMSSYGQSVLSFQRVKNGNDKELVKTLPNPLLMDFQMVGSGYDDSDPWATLLIPKTSEGKKAVGGGTKMTYRYYLQDACFGVICECDPSDVDSFTQALQNPVWDLFLGRKNCVPTEFILQGVFDTEQDAENQALNLAKFKNRALDFKVVEGDHEEGDSYVLNDIPLQFGPVKKYRDRRVSLIQIE